MFFKSLGLVAVLATLSTSTLASSQFIDPNWDFRAGYGDTGSLSNNEIQGNVDGISLSITAWSSSLHNQVLSCKDGDGQDRCIQSVQLKRYSSGLGAVNGDEGNDTPNHSVDNNDQDYDMVLLTFSESVNINNIYTGWNYTYKNLSSNGSYDSRTYGTAGASVLAYVGSTPSSAAPFSTTDTWASIIGPSSWQQIESDTKKTSSVGGLDILPVSNNGIYSKFWLVGAAHSVARDAGNFTDHIKIAGINFVKGPTTNPGTVNAPGILVLFLGCVGLMVARRKK